MKVESSTGTDFERLAIPLFDSLYNFARWLEPKTWFRNPSQRLSVDSPFMPGTAFRAWIFRILCSTFLTSRTGVAFEADTKPRGGGEAGTVAVTCETPESLAISSATREALQYAPERLARLFEAVLMCDASDEVQRYRRGTGDSDRNCHVENCACAQVSAGTPRRGAA
jgi:RNA polymerase sigma-70 factor (ECF subfamily)